MLKIKSNTNEFTIIFSEKIGKKINAEKFSIPALSFFKLQRRTFLFFCFSPLCFVFCFSPLLVSAVFFFSFLFSTTFLVSLDVLPYFFSPKLFSLQPKTFFSSAQKHFFQFSPHYCFSFFFFLLALFSAPPSLFLFCLPFFSAFSHYVLPFFSPSVQLKTFFSCFMSLYLSKSSFSSNLK